MRQASLTRLLYLIFATITVLVMNGLPASAQDGIERHPPAAVKKPESPVAPLGSRQPPALPLDQELRGLDIRRLIYATQAEVGAALGEAGRCLPIPRAEATKGAAQDTLCAYRNGKLAIAFIDGKARSFEVRAATELPMTATSLAHFGIICPQPLTASPYDFTWRRGSCFPYQEVSIHDRDQSFGGSKRFLGEQDKVDPRQFISFVPKVLIQVATVPAYENATALPRLDLVLGTPKSELQKRIGHGMLVTDRGSTDLRYSSYEQYDIQYTNLSLKRAEMITFKPEGNVIFSPEAPRAFGLNCPTDPGSYKISDWTIRSLFWDGTCPPYAWVRIETQTVEGLILPSAYPVIVDAISVRGGPEIAARDRRLFQRLALWLGSERLETPLILLSFAIAAFVLYLLRNLLRNIIRRVLHGLRPVGVFFEPDRRKVGAFITALSAFFTWALWGALTAQRQGARGEVAGILSGLFEIPYRIGIGICVIGVIAGLIVMASSPPSKK